MSAKTPGRRRRRWQDKSRAEKYAFVQSQVLFWMLYVIAIYLVATHIGIAIAAIVFGGGILMTSAAMVFGIGRGRRKSEHGAGERR